MPNKNYTSGSNFERRIIHDLVDMGAILAIRGAGSKSYGKIKADIVALFPSGLLLIAQAKHSRRASKKEQEAFMQAKALNRKVLWWWVRAERYKKERKEIKESIEMHERKRL